LQKSLLHTERNTSFIKVIVLEWICLLNDHIDNVSLTKHNGVHMILITPLKKDIGQLLIALTILCSLLVYMDKVSAQSPFTLERTEMPNNLQKVLDEAINEGKIIFIHFGASYCPPCRKLNKNLNSKKGKMIFKSHSVIDFYVETTSKNGQEIIQTLRAVSLKLG